MLEIVPENGIFLFLFLFTNGLTLYDLIMIKPFHNMKKKLLPILFSCALLLTGCSNTEQSSTKHPYEIYRSEPLSCFKYDEFGDDTRLLKSWYDKHDFTIYSNRGGTYYTYRNSTPQTYVLKHSAAGQYLYSNCFNNKSNDDPSQYVQPYERIDDYDAQKYYEIKNGFINEGSASKNFNSFYSAMNAFNIASPYYLELYGYDHADEELIFYLQSSGFLFAYVDYDAISEYVIENDNGVTAIGRNPCKLLDYKYTKVGSKVKLYFKFSNYESVNLTYRNEDDPNHHNITEFYFEFENNLPTLYRRKITFDETILNNETYSSYRNGFDSVVSIDYGKNPTDPMTLLGKDHSKKDETGFFEDCHADVNPAPQLPNTTVTDIAPEGMTEVYDCKINSFVVKELGDSYSISFGLGELRDREFYDIEYEYGVDGDEASIVSARNNTLTRVMLIPSTIEQLDTYMDEEDYRDQTYFVTSIGPHILDEDAAKNIKSVYIPDYIRKICKDAFDGLSDDAVIYLENKEIPDGFEEGWCPSSVEVVFNEKTRKENHYVEVFSDYYMKTSDSNYVCRLKTKDGGYKYISSDSNELIVPKDTYDLSEIGIYNLYDYSESGPYYAIVQTKPIYSTINEYLLISPTTSNGKLSFTAQQIYKIRRLPHALQATIRYQDLIVHFIDGTSEKVQCVDNMLTIRNFETEYLIREYSFNKQIKQIEFTNVEITLIFLRNTDETKTFYAKSFCLSV